MRQRTRYLAFVASLLLLALLAVSALASPAPSLDAPWSDSSLAQSDSAFTVVRSDDFNPNDMDDWSDSNPEYVKHLLQTTGGGTGPVQPSLLTVNAVNVTVSQCQPTPINIAGIQFYDVNNASLGAIDVTLALVPLVAGQPINHGDFGTLTVQNQAGLIFASGSTGVNQNTSIQFTATSIDVANRALSSLIYTPAAGLVGTTGQVFLEVQGQGATDSTAYATSLSPFSFNGSNYNPIAVAPLDAQSFGNLSAAVNQTIRIPAISVTTQGNPADELSIDIQITNGLITFLTTTGLTFVSSSNSQVINFVGHIADINAALGAINFTALCPTSGSCSSTSLAGFSLTVRDFTNNTQCPAIAVLICAVDVYPGGISVVEAAVPAPVVTIIDAHTVNVTWQSVESTGWHPSIYQPAPTAYAVVLSEDPTTDGAAVFHGLAYSAIIGNLSASTTYTVRIQIYNPAGLSVCPGLVSGGRSVCAPFPTTFTTPGVAPGSALVIITGTTSDSITFSAAPSDSSDVNALLATISSANGTHGNLLIIPVTVAGGVVVEVITGLQPFTAYEISVQARNNAGLGPVTTVSQYTQLAGPQIVGFVASDPTNAANNVVSDGDLITLTFSEATNQPAAETQAEIDALLQFSASIASSYTGAWLDSRTLRLTLHSVGSATPAIGVLTVQVIGELTNAAASGDWSKSSAVLTGNWGLSGLTGYFIAPATPVTVAENGQTYLGVTLNFSSAEWTDKTTSYLLSVQVLSPLLSGVSLNGSSTQWSTGGIFVSSTGLASAISPALATLLLTPPRSYFGSVSVQFSLSAIRSGSSQLIGELVSVVTVNHVNHAPVITAPSAITVPLKHTVAITGVTLSDVDVDVGSLTDAASLLIAASQSGVLSFAGTAQPGVTYAPSFNGSYPAVQITGPLMLVNLALQHLQVNFEYETATFGAPANYFLSLLVNDHGNGGNPILTTASIVPITVTCPTDVSGLQTTSVTSAVLSDTGNQIVITLSLPVSESVLSAPFVPCSTLFSAVLSFGSGAQCQWTSTRQLVVSLGQGATVRAGDQLNLPANAFQRCAGSAAQSVAITRISAIYLAPIAISGPSLGSLCEDLTLTAVTFASSAHPLQYAWTLPGPLQSSAHVTGLDLTASAITIPAAAFSEFGSLPPKFTFGLTVTNFLAQSQSDTFDVVFNSDAKPYILPLTPTTVYVQSTDTLHLAATAMVPSCSSALIAGADSLSIVYSWSSEPAIAGLSLGSASSLSLPASTLSYSVNNQHAYTFSLQAALSSNSMFYAVQTFTVIVQSAPLQARIDGGRMRTVSQQESFTVDASASFDADFTQSSDYSYSWSCASSAPSGSSSGACYLTTGALMKFYTTVATVTVDAGQLAPNAYSFTVQYTHIPTSRVSQAIQTVIVSDSSSTGATLALSVPATVINTGDKLALFASASSESTFSWSIIGMGADARALPVVANSTASASSLVLNPEQSISFFESGAHYGIQVIAVDGEGEVSVASTAVYVNAAPVCTQSLAVSPSSGTAMTTGFEFAIPAASCFDSDAAQEDLIRYRFFRFDTATGLYYWLSAATPESALTNVLLPPGSAVTIGVRVLDARGSFTEYMITVAVSAPQLSTPAQYLAVYQNAIQVPARAQDAVTVAARVGAFVATVKQSSLSPADLSSLQGTALTELLAQASGLPDDAVTAILALIVSDPSSTSVDTVRYVLQYVQSLGNAAESAEELDAVMAIFNGIFGVIELGQGSSSNGGGGSRRRLLASSLDASTLNELNSLLFASFGSVATDISTELLDVTGDRVPLAGSSFTGAIQRGLVGGAPFILSARGSTVRVPAECSALAPAGASFDALLVATPTADFAYLALTGQVSDVLLLSAYLPATRASPLAPHLEPSTVLTTVSAASTNASVTLDIAFDSAKAGGCVNTVDTVTGALCSLECRRWNGTGFDTTGVTTNFNALNNVTFTAQCHVQQPGAFALFRALEVGLVLSSTGASSGGNNAVDQTNAVRASLAFPAPFVITNMRDFKVGLIGDLSAMSGESTSRFTIEQVTTNTASGVTTVILDIWVPTPGSQQASAQSVYEHLSGLAVSDVLSTAYLKSADLSSWQEQCADMVFRTNCNGSNADSNSSWMLPLIVSASAAGFLLCCALVVLTARRYWSAPAKDDKSLDDGFVLPAAAGTQAKQYIYSPPTAGKDIDAEISHEQVSDVTIVDSTAGIDPHSQSGADEEISEPVIVESEAEAAELAKNPELLERVSRSHMDAIHEDEEAGMPELSTNSASASGQSRHFYYVDESRREESQSHSQSVSAAVPSRSASHSISGHHASRTSSHFRIAGAGLSAEPSYSARPSSLSTSSQRRVGMGAHFRYTDNEDAESVSVPAQRSPSHSAIEADTETAPHFQTLSHLELQQPHGQRHGQSSETETAGKHEKRAVRVVRPGQFS